MDGNENKGSTVAFLAERILLGEALGMLRVMFGSYELLAHWLQGEFHHDLLIELPETQTALPGNYLVIATNCNGGIKEVLCFAKRPDRWALWHHRCPDNPDFSGTIPTILERARTIHWFDPCQLLVDDARSELRPDRRRRQRGGGWRQLHDTED